jgi:hypothetical protein
MEYPWHFSLSGYLEISRIYGVGLALVSQRFLSSSSSVVQVSSLSSYPNCSNLFLCMWSRAIANVTPGAIWADLVPTVIALAIYFCFADLVLLSQCFYYNHINSRKRQDSVDTVVSEQEPLLSRRRSSDTIGLPGSHRRRSSARSGTGPTDSLAKILEEDENDEGNPWVRNTVSIAAVIAVGTAGWAIAWQTGAWLPTPVTGGEDVPVMSKTPVGASTLGYISAVCYLGYASLHISQLTC